MANVFAVYKDWSTDPQNSQGCHIGSEGTCNSSTQETEIGDPWTFQVDGLQEIGKTLDSIKQKIGVL